VKVKGGRRDEVKVVVEPSRTCGRGKVSKAVADTNEEKDERGPLFTSETSSWMESDEKEGVRGGKASCEKWQACQEM
jgi:hypothetical protein